MYTDRFALDYIQLHGNEAPEYCRSLRSNGLHLIKAFSIFAVQGPACRFRLQWIVRLLPLRYQDLAVRRFRQPVRLEPAAPLQRTDAFLLSGGINPYSVKALREFRHPYFAGIDINSRFETAPGIKDVERQTS